MKQTSTANGRARIFGMAIQSALGSAALSRKDPVSGKENRKGPETGTALAIHVPNRNQPVSSEDLSHRLENLHLMEPNGYGYSISRNCSVNRISSDVHIMVEDDIFTGIQETSCWVTNNENDSWLKENRLRALQQLVFDSRKLSSSSSISSDIADLNGEMSSESDYQDVPFSNRNNEFEREPALGFSKTRPACSINEKPKVVCENKSQSSRGCCEPVQESQPKSMHVKNSGFLDKPTAKERKNTYADYMVKHKDSYPENYKGCVTVFCKPHSFAEKIVWKKHLEQDNVWGAFGCHPKSAHFYSDKVESALEKALNHPKVRALGEIGLDYSDRSECSIEVQQAVFRRQLKIALQRKLRLVIHCRDAYDDAIKIMHEVLPQNYVFHLHCFTGSWKTAEKWLQEFPNVFIGITNLVTFPSALETHEVARRIPLKRLLLETDAPYFVPTQVRRSSHARFSHPGMAIHVAAQIAALKNIHINEVLASTCANTRVVYNIT